MFYNYQIKREMAVVFHGIYLENIVGCSWEEVL